VRGPVVLEGQRLGELVGILSDLEKSLQTLERRGLNLTSFLKLASERGLPTHRVLLGTHEHWFYSLDEVDAFRQGEQHRLGRELVVADETPHGGSNGHANGNGAEASGLVFQVQELHEVRGHRGVNRGLERLREFGLGTADLLPAPRVAGREPEPRFLLEHDGARRVLAQLRELVGEVRKFGEKGISITRFKGLGEMDGEELWDTTLDPERRTLLRVQLDDALKADEMFRTLMGEKVEPRREFIYEHALEVKDIDYHGA
jgi:DNA gyrase subunit B